MLPHTSFMIQHFIVVFNIIIRPALHATSLNRLGRWGNEELGAGWKEMEGKGITTEFWGIFPFLPSPSILPPVPHSTHLQIPLLPQRREYPKLNSSLSALTSTFSLATAIIFLHWNFLKIHCCYKGVNVDGLCRKQ